MTTRKMECVTIVATGDWHVGNILGLANMDNPKYNPGLSERGNTIRRILFNNLIMAFKLTKPDVLYLAGDIIDGKGERNYGAEDFIRSKDEQCLCAAELILRICKEGNVKEVFMSYGTDSHESKDGEDAGDLIYELIRRDVYCHPPRAENYMKKFGVKIYARHHLEGSAKTRSGQAGAAIRTVVNKVTDSYFDDTLENLPTISIFSHQHKSIIIKIGNKGIIVTPAWQAGSNFGVRKCGGHVDIGVCVLKIYENSQWDTNILRIEPSDYPELLPKYTKLLADSDTTRRVYKEELKLNSEIIRAKTRKYIDENSIHPERIEKFYESKSPPTKPSKKKPWKSQKNRKARKRIKNNLKKVR